MTKFTSNAERRRFDMSTADLNFVSNASKRRFENGIKKDNLLREQAAQRKKEAPDDCDGVWRWGADRET